MAEYAMAKMASQKPANWNRLLKMPRQDISMLDQSRQQEVDDFYKACQMHREQYKDESGHLHPLNYFKTAEYEFQCPTDPTSTYFKYPQYYIQYKSPPVAPLTLERTYKVPSLPQRALTGVYSKHSDSAYKR